MMHKFFNNEYPNLTNNEKALIDYINENPIDFFKDSIEKISENVFVSTGTISRAYKKLGFDSLKEMQFYVYHKYLSHNSELNLENEENISQNILNNLLIYYNNSILETCRNIDLKKIEKISKKIINASEIYFYGSGSSWISPNELSINLKKIGLKTSCISDFHNLILTLASVDEKTILVLFSKTGETKEFLFLIDIAQKYNIEYIIITSNKTFIQDHPNTILYETIEQKNRIHSISSKISQQFVADIIFNLIKKEKLTKDVMKKNIDLLFQWNNK